MAAWHGISNRLPRNEVPSSIAWHVLLGWSACRRCSVLPVPIETHGDQECNTYIPCVHCSEELTSDRVKVRDWSLSSPNHCCFQERVYPAHSFAKAIAYYSDEHRECQENYGNNPMPCQSSEQESPRKQWFGAVLIATNSFPHTLSQAVRRQCEALRHRVRRRSHARLMVRRAVLPREFPPSHTGASAQ